MKIIKIVDLIDGTRLSYMENGDIQVSREDITTFIIRKS